MAVIQFVKRKDLDDAKWNACIEAAPNGLIYGYSFYLDASCSNWDALLLDDYTVVMPLPWRKKWGIHYLYQPFATAQLGLFGPALTPDLLDGFLKKIPAVFTFWDVPLNFGNRFGLPSFLLYERKNYILQLNAGYENIYANYRSHIKRNIKKAASRNCTVKKNIPVDVVLSLAKQQAANNASATDFNRFKNLYTVLVQTGKAVTYGVVSAGGEMLASAVFFVSHQRAYYILAGNHPQSRNTGASHFLIDAFIKDHAAQNLTLDFEGSDVPALQFFYSSFGAVEEPYTAIRYNRLPWFIKWLK